MSMKMLLQGFFHMNADYRQLPVLIHIVKIDHNFNLGARLRTRDQLPCNGADMSSSHSAQAQSCKLFKTKIPSPDTTLYHHRSVSD